jgi:uncharacterized membrane protein
VMLVHVSACAVSVLGFKRISPGLWIVLAIAVFYFIYNLGICLYGITSWNVHENLLSFVAEPLFTRVPYLKTHYSCTCLPQHFDTVNGMTCVNAYHAGQVQYSDDSKSYMVVSKFQSCSP